jgi:ribonuclease BN (tRNA processing enzyme)
LCEASLPPERSGTVQHLTGAEAGSLAREAGAERLLLTHLVPGTDPARHRSEAEATFDGPVLLAAPADIHEV